MRPIARRCPSHTQAAGPGLLPPSGTHGEYANAPMEGSPLRYTCTRATSTRRSSMTCIVARSPRRTVAALRFGPREARMCESGVTFGVTFEIVSAKTFRCHAKSAQRGCRNPFRASRCPSGVCAHMSGRCEAFLHALERRRQGTKGES